MTGARREITAAGPGQRSRRPPSPAQETVRLGCITLQRLRDQAEESVRLVHLQARAGAPTNPRPPAAETSGPNSFSLLNLVAGDQAASMGSTLRMQGEKKAPSGVSPTLPFRAYFYLVTASPLASGPGACTRRAPGNQSPERTQSTTVPRRCYRARLACSPQGTVAEPGWPPCS